MHGCICVKAFNGIIVGMESGYAINAVPTTGGAILHKLFGLYRHKAGRFVLALIRWYRNRSPRSRTAG